MFNPEDFFSAYDWEEGFAHIDVKVTDSQGRDIWGEIPDSFTANDLDAIANYFAQAARNLRDNN